MSAAFAGPLSLRTTTTTTTATLSQEEPAREKKKKKKKKRRTNNKKSRLTASCRKMRARGGIERKNVSQPEREEMKEVFASSCSIVKPGKTWEILVFRFLTLQGRM